MNQAQQILDTLIKMYEQMEVFEHKADGLLNGVNLTELHSIDFIGKTERPNATMLAENMELTRGAITKISKALTAKGLIEKYQVPENKKEVYFRLTESGQILYTEHKKIHNHIQQKSLQQLNKYNEEEQDAILRFLGDISGLHDSKAAD